MNLHRTIVAAAMTGLLSASCPAQAAGEDLCGAMDDRNTSAPLPRPSRAGTRTSGAAGFCPRGAPHE